MVEYETIKSEELKFGTNNFIEIARKKAISDQGEREFISVSKGFITLDGQKRYNKSFSVPDDKAVVEFVCEKLKELV